MSANTAINIFVKAVIRSKSIPFSIQAKEEEDEVTAKAKATFKELRAKAERGETPELTLDEINEEIREVRQLRKERNGMCSHGYEYFCISPYHPQLKCFNSKSS